MKRLPRLLFCLALLIVAGSAVANPYGYAYFRTVTVDHTKVQSTINGYSFYRMITLDHTKVGTVNNTDQTNFPVLLSGTFDGSANALDVRTAANGGPIQNTTTLNSVTVPADLIFTSDSGCVTKLNWEIVNYSASTGVMEAWIKIPTLSHSADTTIYACYKNSSVSTYQGSATSTWSNSFVAVYHLNNNAANTTVTESTGNYTGTNSANTSTTTTAGQITNGFNYAATYGTVAANIASLNGAANMTISAWINPNSLTQSKYIASQADNSFSNIWIFGIDATFIGDLTLRENGGDCESSSHPLGTGSWQYVNIAYNGGNSYGSRCALYYNGSALTVSSDTMFSTLASGGYGFAIAENSQGLAGSKFDSKIDEVQVANTTRSADWVKTAYNNQNSPSTFLKSIGAQTGGPSLTNFPVLVSCTATNPCTYLKTGANGSPGQIQKTATLNGVTVPVDLIFTSDAAGQTLLNWEVASYDATTGNIEIWVNIPTLSATTDTVIYMWYNNANIAATYLGSATSTWDANYLGVWHVNGDPAGGAPQEIDSTTHGKSLSVQCCGTPALVGGKIGNAVDTSYTQGFIGNASSFSTTLTASAWIKTTSGGLPGFMGQFDGNGLGAGFGIGENGTNSGYLRLTVSAGLNGGNSQQTYDASSGSVNDGNWHYAVFTYVSGTGFVMYVDGNSIGTFGAGYTGSLNNGSTFYFVNFNAGGYQWMGLSDEARLSNVARSADWIKTEYNNQNAPSTFTTVGSQVVAHTHAKGFLD